MMRAQVPRLVPSRLLKLELARVAANTSRLMGRRVVPPHVDTTQLSGGEAHIAALLSWVQVRNACCVRNCHRSKCKAANIQIHIALRRTSRF
jgi:hypothetical protein